MKNFEVINLAETLTAYAQQLKSLKGAKFANCIIKNSDLLGKESKTILDSRKIEDSYKEYETKRVELCEKFSNKNEDGTPKKKSITSQSFEYDIDLTNTEFISAIDALKDEYKDVLKLQDEHQLDFNKFLEDESTLELIKISIDSVDDAISVELFSAIKSFIID
jgi:hypothetical protein